MGILDWFKNKNPEKVLRKAMAGVALELFPGGHEQVRRGGEHISRVLKGKLSPEQASKLFGTAMYLAVHAKDRSPERIRASIVARGGGAISTIEADKNEEPSAPLLRTCRKAVEHIVGEKEPHFAKTVAATTYWWPAITSYAKILLDLDREGKIAW